MSEFKTDGLFLAGLEKNEEPVHIYVESKFSMVLIVLRASIYFIRIYRESSIMKQIGHMKTRLRMPRLPPG